MSVHSGSVTLRTESWTSLCTRIALSSTATGVGVDEVRGNRSGFMRHTCSLKLICEDEGFFERDRLWTCWLRVAGSTYKVQVLAALSEFVCVGKRGSWGWGKWGGPQFPLRRVHSLSNQTRAVDDIQSRLFSVLIVFATTSLSLETWRECGR